VSNSGSLVLGFHHPGIVVPDLDRAIEFYTAFLGYETHSESSWGVDHSGFNQIVGLDRSAARFCMLKGPNSYIEIFEYSEPEPENNAGARNANELGIRHLAFVVADVQAALDLCVKLGGTKMNEPLSVPGGATAVYCRDPFGNLFELVEPGGRFPPLITTN